MDKIKKTIVKLFAVMVVAIATLLCGVLLGCGLKTDDEIGNQNPSDTVTPKPDEEVNSGDNGTGKVDESVDKRKKGYSGLCIKADIEEKEEYDIDDVTIQLIYGVDIDKFNYASYSCSASEYYNGTPQIFVSAYNLNEYRCEKVSGFPDYDELSRLGTSLMSMSVGDINDGVYLIDAMPCDITNKYELGGEVYVFEDKFLNCDVLKDTEYEGIVTYPYEVTCNKKVEITLPRELFTNDSGKIEIGFHAYAELDGRIIMVLKNLMKADEKPISFDYTVDGDKVRLSNILLGTPFAVDGTENRIEARTKSLSKSKIVEEKNSENEKVVLLSEDTETRCVGASGYIKWRRDKYLSDTYPARFIKIDVYSQDTNGDTLLGTCYTDENGRYNLSFTVNNIQSEDVYICVNAAGENVSVGNSTFETYKYNTKGIIIPDFENSYAQINVEFDMETQFGQALQVSQAVITADRYATEMNGSALDAVSVVYADSFRWYDTSYDEFMGYHSGIKVIYVPNFSNGTLESYQAWDDIMHEYGHHVQKCLGIKQICDRTHGLNYNMPDHFYDDGHGGINSCDYKHYGTYSNNECKTKGIGIGWVEGWANAYALMAQNYFAAYWGSIDSVCDDFYDVNYFWREYDIEKMLYNGVKYSGDSNEFVVASLLWDFFDTYSTTEVIDNISFGHRTMWNYLSEAKAESLSQFINYISDKVSYNDLAILLNEGKINASDLTFSYNSNGMPTFSWDPRGGSKYYPNNKFELKVYNDNNKLLFSHAEIHTNSYTVNDSELNKLLQNYGDFYWTVDAYQIDDDKGGNCLTGPYIAPLVKQAQIFEYMSTPDERTGVIDGNNPRKYYKFISHGYLFGEIIVVGNNGMNVNCTVYGSSVLSTSKKVSGSGSTVALPYEFTTGGSTVFILVDAANGVTGTFSIKIGNHSHSYDSYTKIDSTNHVKTCACGTAQTEAHSFGSAVFKDPKYHAQQCKCGHEKLAIHVFRTLGNRQICRVCGHTKIPGQDIMSFDDCIGL